MGTGVLAAPHVLIVLCLFLILVGLAILVINPKENNNFMDLSPFVFTRNIPPYSPSFGLCVCGCPDCLIPPFPRTDTGPCPLIVPECFVTGVLVGGVMGAPHVLIVLCLFLVLIDLAILVINPKEKKIIILWICHLLFLQEIFHHIVLVLVFVSVVVPIVLFLRFLVLILVLVLLFVLSVFVTGVLAAPHVLIVLCLFLVLVVLVILVINPKEKI